MYKNLETVLKSEGISKQAYSSILGITVKSVDNKINGITDFTLTEFQKTMLLLRKYSADFVFADSN